jgi:hypothetical protein
MLSTRVSIQWPPEPVGEDTKTVVITTPDNHFVDLRVYLEHYPYRIQTSEEFENVFQWCSCGVERPIANSNKIEFCQEINSIAIWKSIRANEPLLPPEPDIGEFSSIPNSEDRKEVGTMTNPATGKQQLYVEIWRSLDPDKHTHEYEVPQLSRPIVNEIFTLVVSSVGYSGKLVRVGNWAQGIIYNKSNKETPLHVIQSHYDGSWNTLLAYGATELFPVAFNGIINDTVRINHLEWKCIERST